MNRIIVVCILFGIGMLVDKSAVAQSTESAPSTTKIDLDSLVGPEELPNRFVIYEEGCRSVSLKVGKFGKVAEALAAAEKRKEQSSRGIWIATGNPEHAKSLSQSNPNRSSVETKHCYVYSKSLRCGTWTLRLKTLTAQEAEATVAKWKEDNAYPLAIIYELE